MAKREERPRELELKLAISEESVRALARHPFFGGGNGAHALRRHAVTTYFDTADDALAHRGISLRVRATGGEHIQTVKGPAADGLAADRGEWEWPVPGNQPDLSLLARTPLGKHLPAALDLVPVLATHIDRTARIIGLEGGTKVEAALDEGRIVAGDRETPVRELELELKKGEAAPLYRLAAELHAVAPVTIEAESKAARGYRLRSGAPPATRKAEDVALAKKMSAAEACRALLASGLGHLLTNQPAALAGDPEGVHQMRVAIRRLRAVLALFQPLLEPHVVRRFGDELRRIGRIFGEARDWDVFCLEILPGALGGDAPASWRGMLQEPAETRRAAAHERFRQELAAPAFTALVLGIAAWSEGSRQDASVLGDPGLRHKLGNAAPDLLDRLARKLERRGRHFDRLTDPELHAVRKSLKKLRYATDDLHEVFPKKAVKATLAGCKDLQQLLGDINDAVAATALAESLTEGTRPDLAPAVAALAERLRERNEAARRDVAKAWAEFQSVPRFWR